MGAIERTRQGVLVLGLVASLAAQAQAVVGRTEGVAGISSTGAARYTIPVKLPPGTNGLAPRLAIVYDSRGGNGPLGAGFQLAGLSVIHRCGRTLAQDGVLGSVSLDRNDRYCLDGKRLRLTAGTHGYGGSQYQTEVEEFARVTAYGTAGNGPASFQVEARDGLVYEYGATADARVESAGSATVRAWALNRIRDRSGNYVDIAYAEDAVSGSHHPVRIDYTGNHTLGSPPYYAVRLIYEPRPAADLRSGYFAGGKVAESQRIDRIEVQHYGSNLLLRRYDLTYADAGPSGRSRLGSLQECAGSECLPATTFSWEPYASGWGGETSTGLSASTAISAIPGDTDGDGFEDLAYYEKSVARWLVLRGQSGGYPGAAINTGYGASSSYYDALSIDLDGNGKRDLLVPDSGGAWYWLRHTSGTTYAFSSTGVGNASAPGGSLALDVDGDGREDLVYAKPNSASIFWRRNLTTSGVASFAAEAVLWTALYDTLIPRNPFGTQQDRLRSLVRSGDFNGDGRGDLLLMQLGICTDINNCASPPVQWHALVSLGNALETAAVFDTTVAPSLGDFNGDGLTDVVYPVINSDGTATWRLSFATGSRDSVKAGFTSPVVTAATAPADGTMVIDWDGDGRADLLSPTGNGDWQYCRATGTTIETCRSAGISGPSGTSYPIVADVNGDGLTDIVYGASDWRYRLHRSGRPDVLAAATDAYGNVARFEYATLADPGVHARGAGSVFPVRDLVGPLPVVSRLTQSDGTGGNYSITAKYESAKQHLQGRGFLGFARRTLTDSRTGIGRVEDYYQDPVSFDLIGRPYAITLRQVYGSPLYRELYTWSRYTLNPGPEARRFPYAASIVADRFELDGAKVASATTTNTFDAYGTLTSRSTTTTEVSKGLNPGAQHYESVSLLNVANDTANWCLGRPASILVRRSHTLPGGTQVVRTIDQSWDYVRCRQTQDVSEPTNTALRVATDFAYDAYGNLYTETVTPAGQPVRRTGYSWSEGGRFLGGVTNAEGHAYTTAWDPAHARPNWSRDLNGLTTRWQYDGFDRVTRQINPDGTSTVLTRSLCGASNCAWPAARYAVTATRRGASDSYISTSESGFDATDREVYARSEQPGGAYSLRVRRFDGRGQLFQESIPSYCCAAPTRWVTHGYDVLGRQVSVERATSEANPSTIVTRWRHDGLTVVRTDPLGRSTTTRLDAIGNVLQAVDPAGADTDYEYDAFGNLLRLRDVAGNETTLTYDLLGSRTSIVDSDTGRWTFQYSALGELLSQTNARGQTARYTYDLIGRTTSRVEPEGLTTWTWGTSTSAANVGSLASVSSPGFQESYAYDSLGRPRTVTRVVAGTTMVAGYSYDGTTGLLDILTYPAMAGNPSFRLKHAYDRGRLVRLSDADTPYAELWRLDVVSPRAQPSAITLGNGVKVANVYDAVTGQLTSRSATSAGGASYQNLRYTWDSVGNLRDRTDASRGLAEQFTYDSRDRLDLVQRWGSTTLDLSYDDVGNITYKSDIGAYRYDPVRKHAVVAAGSNTYAYDANGAVTSASGSSIAWYSYDLPSQIAHPNGNYSGFYYGADRARYRHTARSGASLTDTFYAVDGRYERFARDGVLGERQYVVADGDIVAVRTRQGSAAPATVFLLQDHLGGVDGFTSSSGALLGKLSYHPMGARRAGDWLGSAPTAAEWQQIQATTPRGYTGHEHLDNLGVIHMNGRVYDPVLARFLSPDPYVQAPYDGQSLNRYSYVLNNPLKYTDPSGFGCFNGHPAGDAAFETCMQQLVVHASRSLGDTTWPDLLGSGVKALANFGQAGNINASDGAPVLQSDVATPSDEIVVTGQRIANAASMLPNDMTLYAGYGLLLANLYGRFWAASVDAGDEAATFYASKEAQTDNLLYRIPGIFAALWTPATADKTSLVMTVAGGLGRWSGRPYWKYTNDGTRNVSGPWLTRGTGWSPPYGTNFGQARNSLQIPLQPTNVVRVNVSPFEYISGPRGAVSHPEWGRGGGIEYYRGWGFPE